MEMTRITLDGLRLLNFLRHFSPIPCYLCTNSSKQSIAQTTEWTEIAFVGSEKKNANKEYPMNSANQCQHTATAEADVVTTGKKSIIVSFAFVPLGHQTYGLCWSRRSKSETYRANFSSLPSLSACEG